MASETTGIVNNRDRSYQYDSIVIHEEPTKLKNELLEPMTSAGKAASIFFHIVTFPISCTCGYISIEPNEVVVLSYFRRPYEILRMPGTYYRNPIGLSQKSISTAIRDVKIQNCEVNDKAGSPLIVSGLVNWIVTDPMKALFGVNNYVQFINDQALTTLKEISHQFYYDTSNRDEFSLKAPSEPINDGLRDNLQVKVECIGLKVLQFTYTNVNYKESMAKILLANTEALAQVHAKDTLSKGVASTVSATLNGLEEGGIKLSTEQKADAAIKILLTLLNKGETIQTLDLGTTVVAASKG